MEIKVDTFLKNKTLSDLKIQPKLKFGLFRVKACDGENNSHNHSIYKLDLASESYEEILFDYSFDSYEVYDDGFILLNCQEGSTTLYTYDGNECRRVCEIDKKVCYASFFNKHIYFSSPKSESIEMNGILESSDLPFLREGTNCVGKVRRHLFRSDLNGDNIIEITDDELDIRILKILDKYDKIIFTASHNNEKNNAVSNVYQLEQNGQVKKLTSGSLRIDTLEWIDEDTLAFMAVDLDLESRNDNQQVYWLNLSSGEVKRCKDHFDYSNESPSIHSDLVYSYGEKAVGCQNGLYAIATGPFNQFIGLHNKSGHEKIETGLIGIYGFQVVDDSLWIIGAEKMGVSELYKYDGMIKKVSDFNPWVKELNCSVPEKITFNYEGASINGLVYPPKGNVKDGPGVLMIHGGPKLMYAETYNHDVQLLTEAGFYVFCANPMGSDGRGNAHLDIRGHYAERPFKELMAFTDHVCEKYPIDSNRLGVTGGSFGGYMTNYIVTKTNRFKAAVSERGISNLMSAMMSSDIGVEYTMEYMNKLSPWEADDMYREASPIYHANKVKTPVLFNHGREDYRCSYLESLKFYSALKYFSVDAKLCIYEGENHGLVLNGKPMSKIKRYKELLDWFMKYL